MSCGNLELDAGLELCGNLVLNVLIFLVLPAAVLRRGSLGLCGGCCCGRRPGCRRRHLGAIAGNAVLVGGLSSAQRTESLSCIST